MKYQKYQYGNSKKKFHKIEIVKTHKNMENPLKNDKHNNKHGSCFIEENNMFYNNIVLK